MTSSSSLDSSGAPAETPYDRLRKLGLTLPPLPQAIANFVPAVREGNLLYLSGQGPVHAGGLHRGKVGAGVTTEEAYEHAKLTGLNLLAVLEQSLGALTRVRRIVKLFGMVNAVPDFVAHPLVINGCSDLLISVFGPDVGRHARSAVGMGSLPGQITVELEMIVAVAD